MWEGVVSPAREAGNFPPRGLWDPRIERESFARWWHGSCTRGAGAAGDITLGMGFGREAEGKPLRRRGNGY